MEKFAARPATQRRGCADVKQPPCNRSSSKGRRCQNLEISTSSADFLHICTYMKYTCTCPDISHVHTYIYILYIYIYISVYNHE